MLQEGQQLIREYKKEIEFLRQEILNMEQRLTALNNENQSSLSPIIYSNFDQLLKMIENQKHENTLLQQQIIEFKKEKSIMQQQIVHLSLIHI